ncbi:CDP-glycerol:glycerophosphate glycerophosphotransferase [Brevibacillus panacihumi]|uniref:CDP-glycerol:glycerophosphate glycerophosphotransferase n=1 Tax=Brevibacillus panacihumi TaxID=497735 RepID=UPI003D02D2BA
MKKVLIASAVRQNSKVLEEFLSSLLELNTDNFETHILLINDNVDITSTQVLRSFAQNDGVFVEELKEDETDATPFIKGEWTDERIWKVASFKNAFIDVALDGGYDFLFLIDADVILQPETLQHLINVNTDIISPIYWTRWNAESGILPQVWVMEQYSQYQYHYDERFFPETMKNSQREFLRAVQTPGIYEIGGLAGCILLSRKALEAGVNFSELEGINLKGEDCHFSLRAREMGFQLFVSTFLPAFHIYQDVDLENVRLFKQLNKKQKITLVYTSLSGANTIALYKMAPYHILNKYDVRLIPQQITEEYLMKIAESDVVVITEGNYPIDKKILNKKQVVVDLWHGFPMKKMGYIDHSEPRKDLIKQAWNNVDYIASYSDANTEYMERCFRAGKEKYRIMGAPRNDFLLLSPGRDDLSKLLETDLSEERIIFYMPTYRNTPRFDRSDGSRSWGNIFDFPTFDSDKFNDFLSEHRMRVILKLHPAEEASVMKKLTSIPRVHVLTTQKLYDHGKDLYEVLNAADLIITDYSSVCYDLLLLDRPLIFTPTDIEQYAETRGFLFDSYNDWTPGPKVLDQTSLEMEIMKCLGDHSYYRAEREIMCERIHYYKDAQSSKRVWDLIEESLANND